MKTIREQIIAAFTDKASSLSVYPVARCLPSSQDVGEPFVTVWDGADTLIETAYGVDNFNMSLMLEYVFKPNGFENVSIAANDRMGAVISTMFSGSRTFNGLCDHLALTTKTPTWPDDGQSHVSITFEFTVLYSTVNNDPYSLAS